MSNHKGKGKASVVLVLVLLSMASAMHADDTIHIGSPGTSGSGWTVSGSAVTITRSGAYVITGTTTTHRLAVASGVSATLTLQDAHITGISASPLSLNGDSAARSEVVVRLSGSNELIAGDARSAGLSVGLGVRLTIEGNGSLTAQGGGQDNGSQSTGGAGIGGSDGQGAGVINIQGGILWAKGGICAAGIGGGRGAGSDSITIASGVTVATAGGGMGDPAGIGGGAYGQVGVVRISGGTVYASSATGPGIGSGAGVSGGQIEITGGMVAADEIGCGSVVGSTPTGISGAHTLVLANAINTEAFGEAGVVTGDSIEVSSVIRLGDVIPDVILRSDLTIADGKTLTIPQGLMFDCNNCRITNQGDLLNYGGEIARSGGLTGNAPNTIRAHWLSDLSDMPYTGNYLQPEPIVRDANRTLIAGEDYSVGYTNNLNKGLATVTVTGRGIYTGAVQKGFNITGKTLEREWLSSVPDQTYTGRALEPDVTLTDHSELLTLGTDYLITQYNNNIEVGVATLVIAGINRYEGMLTSSFNILHRSLSLAQIHSIAAQTYTGDYLTPAVVISEGSGTLVQDRDYKVRYENNLTAGVAIVRAIGMNNYKDTIEGTFTIDRKHLEEENVRIILRDTLVYTGDSLKPEPTVWDGDRYLVLGRDYFLAYTNCVYPGVATVQVVGMNNYDQYLSKTFVIEGIGIYLEETGAGEYVYTGAPITPAITVRGNDNQLLVANRDYSLVFESRTEVGTATFTVIGIGGYAGTLTGHFIITPRPLDDVMLQYDTLCAYTGQPVDAGVILRFGGVLLQEGRDYTIQYENNVYIGEATLYVTGKGNFVGTLTKHFWIRSSSGVEAQGLGSVRAIMEQGGVRLCGLVRGEAYDIIDATGRLVYRHEAGAEEEFVALPQGIYLLRHNGAVSKFNCR